MKSWSLVDCLVGLCAAAILAGCGDAIATRGQPAESWVLPEARSSDLLYVVDAAGTDVYVLTYPGYKLVGTLSGFSESTGACSDSQGNVWIANAGTESLIEYAHGGTAPIATLADPNAYPVSCSYDPKSGDLAVSSLPLTGSANLAVYANEAGAPVLYTDAKIPEILYLSYGPDSELFFDGVTGNDFAMGRFHKGTFAKIRVRGAKIYNGPEVAGGVQYAAGMLTTTSIGSGSVTALLYRMTDSGVIQGSTLLLGTYSCGAYLIWKAVAICPSGSYSGLLIYPYPQGGNYTRKVALRLGAIQAVMSVARAAVRRR